MPFTKSGPLFDRPVRRRDSVTVPTIWIAICVSILVHGIALWPVLTHLRRFTLPSDRPDKTQLTVRLAPPPGARPRPPAASPPAPAAKPRPRPAPPPPPVAKAPDRPRPRPPVLATEKPNPSEARPAAPSAPTRPPSAADLLAYVEAQRQARRDLAPPAPSPQPPSRRSAAEDEKARANRLATENLGFNVKPAFGERRRGGGIFEIERMGYDYAEFKFFGWNKEMRRNTAQLIEVRKGNNSDIRIAVIRQMIAIIRDHEPGDFVWESNRLNRNVTLSARPRDQAGLEDFLMREFF